MTTITSVDEGTFGTEFLAQILEWVVDWFEPNELYTDETLKEWIVENYTPDELWSHEDLAEAME